MKLAKKILACALAIALVACLGVVAFAADAPKANVAAKFAEDGTITVTVSATGAKESAMVLLDYDRTKAEFVSFEKATGDAVNGGMNDGGETNDADKFLSAVTVSSGEFTLDTVAIGTFTLKAKDGVDSIEFTIVEGSNIDENDISGSISVKRDVATTAAPTTAAPSAKSDAKTTAKPTTTKKTNGTSIPKNGDAGIAVVAGISALAAVAFVVTKKK